MKNPLESLHITIGLGVVLTAIMVLIVAIFYWDTGDMAAPASTEPPAASEGAATEPATSSDAATGDAAGSSSTGDAGADTTTTGE